MEFFGRPLSSCLPVTKGSFSKLSCCCRWYTCRSDCETSAWSVAGPTNILVFGALIVDVLVFLDECDSKEASDTVSSVKGVWSGYAVGSTSARYEATREFTQTGGCSSTAAKTSMIGVSPLSLRVLTWRDIFTVAGPPYSFFLLLYSVRVLDHALVNAINPYPLFLSDTAVGFSRESALFVSLSDLVD